MKKLTGKQVKGAMERARAKQIEQEKIRANLKLVDSNLRLADAIEAEGGEETDNPPGLNQTELDIIEALGENSMTGPELATKSGYAYQTIKPICSSLRRQGVLVNEPGKGYFVAKK